LEQPSGEGQPRPGRRPERIMGDEDQLRGPGRRSEGGQHPGEFTGGSRSSSPRAKNKEPDSCHGRPDGRWGKDRAGPGSIAARAMSRMFRAAISAAARLRLLVPCTTWGRARFAATGAPTSGALPGKTIVHGLQTRPANQQPGCSWLTRWTSYPPPFQGGAIPRRPVEARSDPGAEPHLRGQTTWRALQNSILARAVHRHRQRARQHPGAAARTAWRVN